MKLTLALLAAGGVAAWAAEPTPLDLKTGEWEYTMNMQMGGGMPQMQGKQIPQIPPEQLAKLPPDQRAKLEAALKQAGDMASGKPVTNTSRNCVKKEDLTNFNPPGMSKTCKTTVTNSSRTRFEAKVVCNDADDNTTSTVVAEAVNSESLKISVVSTGTQNGRPANMTFNGTGKWLGASCTENK